MRDFEVARTNDAKTRTTRATSHRFIARLSLSGHPAQPAQRPYLDRGQWRTPSRPPRAPGHQPPELPVYPLCPKGTITTADVGLDRFIENEDGTIRVGTRKDSERRVRARGVDLGPALIAGGRWNLIRTRGTRLPCCHQQGGVPVRDRFAWELHRRLEALAPHADA
jgi:hypothetical protein